MDLKIKFMPYEQLKIQKFNGIFKDLSTNTIVLVDAKLTAKEEAQIIAETMRKVSDKFSGIELGSVEYSQIQAEGIFPKIRNALGERLLGKKRGLTIIGPAKIVRKIKKNPEELLLNL